jgi:hypothetical protein
VSLDWIEDAAPTVFGVKDRHIQDEHRIVGATATPGWLVGRFGFCFSRSRKLETASV